MNVGELIEELKKHDPNLPVSVGVICSCYGVQRASEVQVLEDPAKYQGEVVVLIE